MLLLYYLKRVKRINLLCCYHKGDWDRCFFIYYFHSFRYLNLKNGETFKLIFKSSGKQSLSQKFFIFSNWKFSISFHIYRFILLWYLHSKVLVNLNITWIYRFKPQNIYKRSDSIAIYQMHRKCQLKMRSKNRLKHNMKKFWLLLEKTKRYCQVWQCFRFDYNEDFSFSDQCFFITVFHLFGQIV